MKATRNVVIDLLPLYLSDEVSDDTKAFVREYLATDPELEEMAREAAKAELPEHAPVPLTWEDNMKAYKEAKRLMLIRTIFLAAIISFSVLAVLALGGILVSFFLR